LKRMFLTSGAWHPTPPIITRGRGVGDIADQDRYSSAQFKPPAAACAWEAASQWASICEKRVMQAFRLHPGSSRSERGRGDPWTSASRSSGMPCTRKRRCGPGL
jgi:hypothetical protein